MSDRPLSTSDLADTTTDPQTTSGQAGSDVDTSTPDTTAPAEQQAMVDDGVETETLLPDDQSERFTGRWQEIQAGFVDQPRQSVEAADALVADLMQRLAATFSNERERLEQQWDRGDDVSTEDLRVALTRYRSFFERLLTA